MLETWAGMFGSKRRRKTAGSSSRQSIGDRKMLTKHFKHLIDACIKNQGAMASVRRTQMEIRVLQKDCGKKCGGLIVTIQVFFATTASSYKMAVVNCCVLSPLQLASHFRVLCRHPHPYTACDTELRLERTEQFLAQIFLLLRELYRVSCARGFWWSWGQWNFNYNQQLSKARMSISCLIVKWSNRNPLLVYWRLRCFPMKPFDVLFMNSR